MAAKIEIDHDAFQAGIQKMDSSLENFRPYSKNFIEQMQDSLDGMNGDFISEMIDVLGSMRDTKAPELMKALGSHQRNLKFVYAEFVEKDLSIATGVGGATE